MKNGEYPVFLFLHRFHISLQDINKALTVNNVIRLEREGLDA